MPQSSAELSTRTAGGTEITVIYTYYTSRTGFLKVYFSKRNLDVWAQPPQ